MAQGGIGLIRAARLTRRQLIAFAMLSAVLNGVITATVGAWLGQTYARYQSRRQSIESLVHLIYERRTRAGMVTSAIKRGADLDEVRFRKRAYDEAYVEWNKNIMQNIFAIREVTGEHMISTLEGHFQDGLVEAMSDVDRCLTKAYDVRLANGEPKLEFEKCRMPELHQFVLDCGATFTNELYKLTKLTFTPFKSAHDKEGRDVSELRIKGACTRSPPKPVAPALPPAPIAQPDASPVAASPVAKADPAASVLKAVPVAVPAAVQVEPVVAPAPTGTNP